MTWDRCDFNEREKMLYKERENIILFKIYVYTMVKTWKGRRSLSEGFEESRFKKLKPYNNQTSIEMDIGNNCRVYAQRYGKTGDWNVHIRFYDTSPTGKLFPSKKGISMPLDKYKKFWSSFTEIRRSGRRSERRNNRWKWRTAICQGVEGIQKG